MSRNTTMLLLVTGSSKPIPSGGRALEQRLAVGKPLAVSLHLAQRAASLSCFARHQQSRRHTLIHQLLPQVAHAHALLEAKRLVLIASHPPTTPLILLVPGHSSQAPMPFEHETTHFALCCSLSLLAVAVVALHNHSAHTRPKDHHARWNYCLTILTFDFRIASHYHGNPGLVVAARPEQFSFLFFFDFLLTCA
jgi:hypothetical protein